MSERKLKCNTCGHVIGDRQGGRLHEHCTAAVLGVYEPIDTCRHYGLDGCTWSKVAEMSLPNACKLKCEPRP